jgi:hypothetical protein
LQSSSREWRAARDTPQPHVLDFSQRAQHALFEILVFALQLDNGLLQQHGIRHLLAFVGNLTD